MGTGLAEWLRDKAQRAPIAFVVVTRGTETTCPIDRLDPFPGEEWADFARRIELAAEDDAAACEDAAPYFAHLFRDERSGPEARRALKPPMQGKIATKDEQERGAMGIVMRGLTDALRTNSILTKLGIDKHAAEVDRANAQTARIEGRYYEAMDRMGAMALAQEELAERREERKERHMMYQKLLEQAEIFLPLFLSEYMSHGHSGSGPNLSAEARLLDAFVKMLSDEQIEAVVAQLDGVQQAALFSLQQGKVDPSLVPATVQRVMRAMTREQILGIARVLTTDEQRSAFQKLHAVHALGLGERVKALVAGDSDATKLQ